MKTILYTWFAVLLFGMAAVSCGDDDTKNNDTTGITGSSWKASETVGADRTTKKYTFKASANWVAQSDKPEWCKILTSSGDKGSDRQLNITVEANETGSTRSANITVQVSGYARAAQFAITQLGSSSGGTGADTELNKQVDKILEYYYLWNGEYRQMSRDLSLDYISSSDNFLKRTLLEMTTNDLDKKRQSNGSYSVYSYLLRTPLTKAVAGTTRGVSHGVVKEKEYGFGIAGLMGVRFVDGNNQPTGEYGLVVTSVYPDSPASEAGFRRGTFFAQYNGAAITAANLNSVYGTLIAPGGASTVKLTENKQGAQPVSLTAREIYPNPVIHSEVITSGAHRIGYLVYDSFDAAYDDELLAAVKRNSRTGTLPTWCSTCATTAAGTSSRRTCFPPASPAQPARARSTNITGTTTAAWPRSKKRRGRLARSTTRRQKNSSTNSITATITASTCGTTR